MARWQRRIDPVWTRLAGGCHTGRDIPVLIREAGLRIETMEQMYIPGPKVLSYNYWGTATVARQRARFSSPVKNVKVGVADRPLAGASARSMPDGMPPL